MVTSADRLPVPRRKLRVAYTRGSGCAELASVLATGEPVRVIDDIGGACLKARADVLVTRKLSSFDLTNQVVPHDFDPDLPMRVAALVGTGPHSQLAGRIAARLGRELGWPVDLVTAYSSEEGRLSSGRALQEVSRTVGVPGRLVHAPDVSDLIDDLGESTLLVFGAAGGPLLQRLFFGPGVRLRARAPAGALIVRAAPVRVFRKMEEPQYVGGHMSVSDAARVTDAPVVAVVEDGRLIGVVHREALSGVAPDVSVSEVMAESVSVSPEDPLTKLEEVIAAVGYSPIPVTDRQGILVGSVLL